MLKERGRAIFANVQAAASEIGTAEIAAGAVTTAKLAAGAVTNAEVGASAAIAGSKLATNVRKQFAVSVEFDLDNGAGTTVDAVILRPSVAITITAARIVYTDATTGTVAAGNARIGTTVGGSEVVAATAYGNAAAVGSTTAMSIVAGAVAAATPVIVRHTGVAATQAGKAQVEIEFTVND